jgi:oligosaccharide reducing-end xylanase
VTNSPSGERNSPPPEPGLLRVVTGAMNRFRCLLLVLALVPAAGAGAAEPGRGAFASGHYRNLFGELLGRTDAEVDAKIQAAWQQLFYGRDDTQRVYYPAGPDQAYIADIGNGEVRSEGMSYGMMIAVQLDPGSASDGEEWFAMALFFAAHRWDAAGTSGYGADAQALLRAMLLEAGRRGGNVTSLFDRTRKQVVFAPTQEASTFTDPSYHLPAFYELWARWAQEDGPFWSGAAATSRELFRRAAHPRTGLMPDFSDFDGAPRRGGGREDFRFDAWRTLGNVGLDYAWFAADPWQVEQSNRVLAFLAAQGPAYPNQFALDGRPLSSDHSPGLAAMAAVAGLAADPKLAHPFVQQLWDTPIPTGKWRYFDGLLYFMALLEVSGRFQIYGPPAQP